MSVSNLEVNIDQLTTPYKRFDEYDNLRIGTWLATLCNVNINNGSITFIQMDRCVSSESNECILAPMLIKLESKSMEEDISVRITYRFGTFSHWDVDDKPHWVTEGIDTVEVVIPAYSGEASTILVGVYDSCEVLEVELLRPSNANADFKIFGLASNNTKLLHMMTFDELYDLGRELFLNRFIYYLPSWDNPDETYPRGRLAVNEKIAEKRAEELKVERKSDDETHERFCQRIQGKRYWVIPRNRRNIDSNIHYLMARYLDLSENDIIIREKSVNISSENPDESSRNRIWSFLELDGWEENGIKFENNDLLYSEYISNKNFSDRTYISSINGIDKYWINVFDGDGQFNNTEELTSNRGYCFIVGNRGAPTDNRGYAAFQQQIDFTEMTQMRFDFRLDSIPSQLFTPPGFRLGRFWVVASTRRLSGYDNNIEDLIDDGTILYEHVLNHEHYPNPSVSRITLNVSGLTGNYYLYFIVKSNWQFVEASIDRIYYDYGTATCTSPILDTTRIDDFIKIFPFTIYNDSSGLIQWRYRYGDNDGEIYDADWSGWLNINQTDINFSGRLVQIQFRFESNVIMATSPLKITDFYILGKYFPTHNIILDPTYVVSLPAERRGNNYMWSYASRDQTAFKEIVDSTCPAGITARTEFYLETIEDEI